MASLSPAGSTHPIETNSNYGTIFSSWDRIFRTYRLKTDQEKLVEIGLEEFQDKRGLTFRKLWAMPLKLIGHHTPAAPNLIG